eukprot:CAMPEP_0168590288 /NCGR_PEP_ID=MMETSP0420-20121227/6484_1 /TAXON_ID=498008 /ORGANISM="Pessonella sp." /LENGTH=271 /DNA_ID=CAMNT_0008625929 /DNA_START=133 /DNA_END=948 /DNA_ORIENTATION=+
MSTRDDCSFEESDLLLCEFIVLEELNYDLVVYHSYPMLEALATNAELIDSCGNLWRIVNDSYLTDAALRHAPHVVAVACLHVVAHNRQLDLSAWFAKLNVDHAAVWDVVRRVLDLYELCDELRNTPGTTSTAAAARPLATAVRVAAKHPAAVSEQAINARFSFVNRMREARFLAACQRQWQRRRRSVERHASFDLTPPSSRLAPVADDVVALALVDAAPVAVADVVDVDDVVAVVAAAVVVVLLTIVDDNEALRANNNALAADGLNAASVV